MLANYSWPRGLSLSVVDTPSEAPLEKTKFSSASGCQLQIPCWLGVGALVYFLLTALGSHLTWNCAGPVPAATVSVSSNEYQPSCIWRALFLWGCPSCLGLRIFLPPLLLWSFSPEWWWWGLDEDILFRTECSKVSCFLHFLFKVLFNPSTNRCTCWTAFDMVLLHILYIFW